MNEVPEVINKKGVVMRTLVDHKNATVRNLNLQIDQKIPPHSVDVDVFFYIISGEGSITIGEKTYHVSPTDIVVCPPNTPMSVHANKDTTLSFLNVKTPQLS